MTEDETVGWHHRLHGHESEQAPGDGEGQGGLACCGPWARRESDTTEPLNKSDQAPLSRQEYWSGLPCSPPWDLPDAVMSRITGISLPSELPKKRGYMYIQS